MVENVVYMKTHEGLNMEKEHADDTVTRFVQFEEVDQGILEELGQNLN